jgi:flagellar protein FliT
MPTPEPQGAVRVIANFESLAALTEQMLAAAQAGKWDVLVSVERKRNELVVAMQQIDAAAVLDEAANRRKRDVIVQVKARDEEIRQLTQAWMDDFRLTMQSSQQELRLARKYGL